MVSSTIDAAKSGILFDGFPRTVAQAKALAEIGDIDAVIMLDADEDLVTQRICSRRICSQCGAVYNLALLKGDKCEACAGELIQRADDSEETARERFQVYMKNTQPLVDFYREQGILHVVDANRTAKEVAADVVRILSEQK